MYKTGEEIFNSIKPNIKTIEDACKYSILLEALYLEELDNDNIRIAIPYKEAMRLVDNYMNDM